MPHNLKILLSVPNYVKMKNYLHTELKETAWLKFLPKKNKE